MRTCEDAHRALSDALAHFQSAARALAVALDHAGAWTERNDRSGAEFLAYVEDAVQDFPELVLRRVESHASEAPMLPKRPCFRSAHASEAPMLPKR